MPATPLARAHALTWLIAHLPDLPAERIPLASASGRLLAETILPLAHVPTAAIDGHAVLAAATDGASDYAPLPIASTPILAGHPLPPGADAILPLDALEHGAALAPIPPGHGLVTPDAAPLDAGTRLTPLHIAILALRGHATPLVLRRPRIALRIPGPKNGPDALTPLLTTLLETAGATIDPITPDLILLAGRSGPGSDDTAPAAFTHLAAHGLLIHPGDTAAIGTVGDTPAILLPGDPLACFLTFHLLAAPALRHLTRQPDPAPIQARLTRKIVSGLGHLEAVPIHLADGDATPLPPLLSAVATATGLALVPEGSEGYPAGATIAIYPI